MWSGTWWYFVVSLLVQNLVKNKVKVASYKMWAKCVLIMTVYYIRFLWNYILFYTCASLTMIHRACKCLRCELMAFSTFIVGNITDLLFGFDLFAEYEKHLLPSVKCGVPHSDPPDHSHFRNTAVSCKSAEMVPARVRDTDPSLGLMLWSPSFCEQAHRFPAYTLHFGLCFV